MGRGRDLTLRPWRLAVPVCGTVAVSEAVSDTVAVSETVSDTVTVAVSETVSVTVGRVRYRGRVRDRWPLAGGGVGPSRRRRLTVPGWRSGQRAGRAVVNRIGPFGAIVVVATLAGCGHPGPSIQKPVVDGTPVARNQWEDASTRTWIGSWQHPQEQAWSFRLTLTRTGNAVTDSIDWKSDGGTIAVEKVRGMLHPQQGVIGDLLGLRGEGRVGSPRPPGRSPQTLPTNGNGRRHRGFEVPRESVTTQVSTDFGCAAPGTARSPGRCSTAR